MSRWVRFWKTGTCASADPERGLILSGEVGKPMKPTRLQRASPPFGQSLRVGKTLEDEDKKNRWTGILIGPALTLFALAAIWKNENRFDFYRASAETKEIASFHDEVADEAISFTGPMDPSLTMAGEYVESFTGFLLVQRSAEIYAWDEDKDSEGGTNWSRKWMSQLESNSRNRSLDQKLSSRRILPSEYRVGELTVTVDEIELVDAYQSIAPGQLTVQRQGLVPEGDYFYLRKQRSDNLGDERISYRGIPIPPIATYFGKLDAGRGVPDARHRRSGFVNELIRDSGVLHHVAAGDRKTALATIKGYLSRLKWSVRGIASAAVVVGVWLFFSTFVGWLYHLPVIGRVAEFGTFVAAMAIGLVLASVTMVTGYLIAHPLILVSIVCFIAIAVVWIRARGSQSQSRLRNDLSAQFGHELSGAELKELEFIELAQLVISDGKAVVNEVKVLKQFAHNQGWDQAKFADLLNQAKRSRQDHQNSVSNDQHLFLLIKIALADGNVSPQELRFIRKTASMLGYSNAKVRDLIHRVRHNTPAVTTGEVSPALVG